MLWVHVIDDLLGHVLRVRRPALHDGEEQLGRVVLQLEDEVHAGLAQGVDVVEDERRDDAEAVRLVHGDAGLVLVARTLRNVPC